MLYTKPKEIERVKLSLPVFDGRLARFETAFATPQYRHTIHSIFFSLCNPGVYPFLLPALEAIKSYNQHEYFPKAVKKLVDSSNHLQHSQTITEIIVFGYYCRKFLGDAAIKVVWERKIPGGNRNPDISLIGPSMPVNIEVTSLAEDKEVRDYEELSYGIEVALELMAEALPDQQYCYLFEVKSPTFTTDKITDFVKFTKAMRQKGEGDYDFKPDGVSLATLQIMKLNKLKREYASDMGISGGWMANNLRLRHTITEKAKRQLPANEINFVFAGSLGLMSFDDIDSKQAFLGSERWVVSDGGAKQVTRAEDGAIHTIRDESLSPVYGLIYTVKGRNYTAKQIVVNPLAPPDEVSLNLIR